MPDWISVAAAADCPPGTSIERVAGERMVAIANVDGRYHAIDGLCPHQGGPLGTGMLCGSVLTCPWHGWQFDVTTGRHGMSATVRQTVHEVRERDGMLFVRLAADAGPPVAAAPHTPREPQA
jgi:nitrite reductase/ring-hydroxylating ferredoxin subunit